MLPLLCNRLLSHAIGHVYPAFRSYRALAGRGGRDALKPWLVYWSVLGLFRVGEYFADMALFWLPFYEEMKLALVCWLALPTAQGAGLVYSIHVRPLFSRYEKAIVSEYQKWTEGLSGILGESGGRALFEVHRFVAEQSARMDDFVRGAAQSDSDGFEDVSPAASDAPDPGSVGD